MKKRLFILLVTAACFGPARAQVDTLYLEKQVTRCADSLSHGFLKKDWEIFMRYTFPALIGTIGGKEEFVRQLNQRIGMIPGSAWKKYEPGKVLQIVKTEKDLQAIVELFSVLEWQGLRITTTHHLVAESWNGGQHWTFFDSQNDRNIATIIKPDLSPLLVIPPKNEKAEPLQN